MMIKTLPFLGIILCFFSQPIVALGNDQTVPMGWSYKGNVGPSYWGSLDSHFALCATGKEQSPINIAGKIIKMPNTLQIHYQPSSFTSVLGGTTKLNIGNELIEMNDGHSVQLNFPQALAQSSSIIKTNKQIAHHASQKNNAVVDVNPETEWISLDHFSYRLLQLHFHSPSENKLKGRNFPLEIQLVHQGEQGKLVIMGIFVDEGKENPALQMIIDHLPKEQTKEEFVSNDKINPMDLLPVKRDYYRFDGSLTVPPCTQGVQWIMMASPINASPVQIFELRKAMGAMNARPVQTLNQRVINYAPEN